MGEFYVWLAPVKMVYAEYGYEYSLSKIYQYTFGTHEICLVINLGLFGVGGIGRSTVEKL
jgi:hypothetical protein